MSFKVIFTDSYFGVLIWHDWTQKRNTSSMKISGITSILYAFRILLHLREPWP